MMSPYRRLINGIKNILRPQKTSKEAVVDAVLQPQTAVQVKPRVNHVPLHIPRAGHTLSRSMISKSAVSVLYKLHNAGYQAFLVGGGVRDVLVGRRPKDFDVVTNALPEQVRSLFRHCRLIGRRFVLAHVYFGDEIVEVATFRAQHDKSGDGVIQDGRIIRDNVYGTIDEDAWRRDFTINALYYDISDFALLDYTGGMKDLDDGVIRLIGDPIQRYQEDPVRMLRAIRFAAKLKFTIDASTSAPIFQLPHLLKDVNTSRLYEEILKLFFSGHSLQSFNLLRDYKLFDHLFPQTAACLNNPDALTLLNHVFKNTDERLMLQKPVSPAFLFAALLWQPLQQQITKYLAEGRTEQDSLFAASRDILTRQVQRVGIPKRVSLVIHEIWLMQPRLTRRKSKRNFALLEHGSFKAGYDFLLLRASAGETSVDEYAKWWTQFFHGDDATRNNLLFAEEPRQPAATVKRMRRRRKPSKRPLQKDAPPSINGSDE
jgi:poly(A) polymerase